MILGGYANFLFRHSPTIVGVSLGWDKAVLCGHNAKLVGMS